MARPEKVAVVEEIREKLAASDAAVLAEYRGLKVGELAELRAALRPAGAEFKIFKNTLARRAAEEAGPDRTWSRCCSARRPSPSSTATR